MQKTGPGRRQAMKTPRFEIGDVSGLDIACFIFCIVVALGVIVLVIFVH